MTKDESPWKFTIICLLISAVIAVPILVVKPWMEEPVSSKAAEGNTVTLQDETELAGSNHRLMGDSVAITGFAFERKIYILTDHHALVMEQFELLRADMKALTAKIEELKSMGYIFKNIPAANVPYSIDLHGNIVYPEPNTGEGE